MSIVPNERLESADSLELIIFGEKLVVDGPTQFIDIYSRFRSYWKKAVVRNRQSSDVLEVFTDPNDQDPDIVEPNGELPIKGWGSYLRVESAAASPNGIVDFECVRLENALKTRRNQ